jgi:diguanylate cyclase (GGDEF)-like protein
MTVLTAVGRRPARVLLLEADPAMRDVLRRELADGGFSVVEASDVERAAQQVRERGVDVALLGRSGDGLTPRALRERLDALHQAHPLACILIARTGDAEILTSLGECAEDFLSWPAPPGHALERVRLVLRRALDAGAAGDAESGTLLRAVEPANVDRELVGVLSRAGFLQVLERSLREATEKEGHVGVLSLDLSQLKLLSGALSHESGTVLLASIVERLREGLRRDDLFGLLIGDTPGTRIGRLRSDELTLLLPDLRRPTDALEVGRRLLGLLDQPFSVEGRDVFVTVCIGLACSPSDGVDGEELLRHAETATLCARQQGRHTVLAYTPAMDARAFERLTLETGLRRALEREELVVHYQPRVDIATAKLVGLEALVRWRHPDQGLVAPGQFIALAEETGLIVPIGNWVLRQACTQVRAWQQAGLSPLRVSVNISSVQFRQPDLFEVVARTLQETGLESRWLELELTESLLMQNPEDVVVLLERLSAHGVYLSIDDFGTGYSSLSYLRRFPIDALKIDRAFIRELTTNPDDAAIATSIILMGKALRLNVVAEGVETRSQLSFLRVMKCQEAQGYLFSPPLPAADVERLLRSDAPLFEEAA